MTYVIIKEPHPLDKVWGAAIEAVEQANGRMELLGSDFTDAELDAAGDVRTAAILTVLALPARNLSDSLYKLDLAGIDGGHLRNDCDPSAIINEANDVLNAALRRGHDMKREGARNG